MLAPVRKPFNSNHIKFATEDMDRAMYLRWFVVHSYNLEVIARTSGVTIQTVRKWHRLRKLPRPMAVMVDQVLSGPIVQMNLMRGISAIRPDKLQGVFRGADSRRRLEEISRAELEAGFGRWPVPQAR